jgi:rhamnogalacturonyl hydrolase YesR
VPRLTVPTDDIVLQWDKITAITLDPDTNLPFHGYDEGKKAVWADPETGVAPIIWSRAVGWYIWSLVEVLHLFPRNHPGWERLLGYYTTVADGLKRAQDPESHGWWLVMNEPYPGKEGNYFESSAAAMFTYGWLAGLREGWLDEAEYAGPATKAYEHLIEDFVTENANGTLTWEGTVEVGSLGSNATFEVSFSFLSLKPLMWSFVLLSNCFA